LTPHLAVNNKSLKIFTSFKLFSYFLGIAEAQHKRLQYF
jgi:hypothetical protein